MKSSTLSSENARVRWSLQLFGGFRLRTIAGESVPLGKRERVLLAYLALCSDGRQSRRKLATLLWGDASDATALDNLRVSVWGLRRALNDADHLIVQSDDDELVLDADAFKVDVWDFRRLASQADRDALDLASDLYTGDFLEGLSIDSEEFESWRRGEAASWRHQAIETLARLMRDLSDSGEAERAIQIGQRLLNLDAMHEAAVRHMMRLHAYSGRRPAALQLYNSLVDTLRSELSAEPEAETQALFAELSSVKKPGALTPARQRRPVVATGTIPWVGVPRDAARAPNLSARLKSRLMVPRWMVLAAPLVALAFLSLPWLWPSLSWHNLRAFSAVESAAPARDLDPETYEKFLYARSLAQGQMGVFGPQPLHDAAAALEQITARYPDYAPAWALLGQVYDNLPGSTWNPGYEFLPDVEDLQHEIEDTLAKGERAAKQSLRLDPQNADAYLALGRLQQSRGKLVEAEQLLSKAFQLEPNNSGVLRQYSTLLSEVGRSAEALAMQEQLVAQEAFVPNIAMNRARYLWLNGQNETAIAILKTLPNGRPNNNIARILASMGRFAEAARLLAEDAATPNPPMWTDDAARLLLSAPAKAPAPGDLPRLGLTESYIYAYVGAPERVLEPYEEVAETGYAPNVYIQFVGLLWHPVYSEVRKTERFKTLARKIGLVDYWRARGWPDLCHPTTADDFACN